ncbi:hypothetical protein QJS04_geneDACA023738 [Acorus gramineus]|uniref:KxDL domain-containing protein n=1 Tax=Acorus gramineus TaxID=55184 RepID=A0AAV9BQ03_ACOGR|nr:hypothetical protein QJS04_geneDACA023738 [Acorus gramineus]
MADEEKEGESTRAASSEVSNQFKTLIDASQIDSIKHHQLLVLGRIQDSNAVLGHFNEYSERCFGEVSSEAARNARLLRSVKADLDHVFVKLRNIKRKIAETYPDAFPEGSAVDVIDDRRPDLERPHPLALD